MLPHRVNKPESAYQAGAVCPHERGSSLLAGIGLRLSRRAVRHEDHLIIVNDGLPEGRSGQVKAVRMDDADHLRTRALHHMMIGDVGHIDQPLTLDDAAVTIHPKQIR